MNRELLSKALCEIDESFIAEAYRPLPEAASGSSERIVHMKKKRIITFALAAALTLALGAMAYAADLFGLQALLITNGRFAHREDPDRGYLSITQPQAVPEEMDTAVREKIDHSAKAWAEWDAWRRENGPRWPESCKAPENASAMSEEENGDGTYTLIFYDGVDESGAAKEIGRRVVSAEDYKQFQAYLTAGSIDFPGYDFNYDVSSQEMADKLEAIAASYGLRVRHQSTQMWQNYGEGTLGYSKAEITAKINDICAGGKRFFRTEPTGYDKFYYFDEGTFAVSFFTGADQSYTGTSCYLYNSPYGTLSSGYEIFDVVKDISAFTVRSHSTPDGAELTVLQNETEAFAYIYLDNSFVTLHISQAAGMGDAEIDAILDMVDFSTIR